MADFEIIEADFQQFYNLDVGKLKFQRYARLLINLPRESRFIQKYLDFKDWTWEKEVQSQILRAIEAFTAVYVNSNRKKGTKKAKVPDLMEPDYVKQAKKNFEKRKKENLADEKEHLRRIFEEKNPEAKYIG